MKLIDKDALVAEIERRQRKTCVLSQSNDVELRKNAAIQNGVYCSLLSLLDTLEVKEVDLERELDKFYGMDRDKNGVTHDMQDNEICLDWKEGCNFLFIIEFAKHFFELGLKAKQG